MTVVVAYKWAPDPHDAHVGADGAVDWSRGRPAISEYDQAAIAAARVLADASACDLIGISVGGPDLAAPQAKKAALARGLDRAIVVADPTVGSWNPTRVAAALAQLARRVDPTVVVTGDASSDEGGRIVPALIAGYLNWPCFLQVSAVRPTAEGFQLEQRAERVQRTIDVAGPVLVSMTPAACVPTTPGMKDMLAAARKPLDVVALADLTLTDVPVVLQQRQPTPRIERARRLFTGADAAAEALAAMRADGVLASEEGRRD